jgi:anti-sigma B factor antagonist
MQFRERHVNGKTVIDVQGDLVVNANPGALQTVVKNVLARGERQIVVNVAGIVRMDSTCLGELVASYTSTVACGGVLKLAAPNEHIRRLLELTRLDEVIKTFATDDEAIADFMPQEGAIC